MSLRIYGNRLLRTPTGLDTRPTLARVRTAVFGRWQERVSGCRWLDLCAGAGTMGAEALARGAASALGIELGARAARLAAENWEKIAPGCGSIWKLDVLVGLERLARAGEHFDLIYFDPPYRAGLYEKVLQTVDQRMILSEHGEMAAEHDRRDSLPERVGTLVRVDSRTYSDTTVSYYRRAVPEAQSAADDSARAALSSSEAGIAFALPDPVVFEE
jgi:16S rRNA (guanine(966)-N(2))-methyltransferase RsmD